MTVRRPATPEEARAMASALRLRILRLCLDEALTNKEIAGRLGLNPGTTLHHVRLLVETGFLAADDPRRGARGAQEKPYRATGKSWRLDIEESPEGAAAIPLAVVDAVRAELAEAGPGARIISSRLAIRLGPDALDELGRRLDALAEEFAARDDRDGEPVAMYLLLHRRRPGDGRGSAAPG